MITSMTGFGRGVARQEGKRIQVEIKSVNSKQLDISMRLPSRFKEMEITLRNPLGNLVGRGKVEVWATIENLSGHTEFELNQQLLEGYKLQIIELGKKLSLPEPEDWYSILLRMPDSLKNDNSSLTEEEEQTFMMAFNEAIMNLIDFRKTEGEKLYSFFCEKITSIENLLQQIAPFEEERIVKIKERLTEHLEKLDSIEYDRARLEQELIFYIEKLDVTEEKVRLQAHLNYFKQTLDNNHENPGEGQGKKLGFITQEIGREINTLGSKSNHAEMQKIVVMMKDELEQIKEQVMNVL